MNKLFKSKRTKKLISAICIISMSVSMIVVNPQDTYAFSLRDFLNAIFSNKNQSEQTTTQTTTQITTERETTTREETTQVTTSAETETIQETTTTGKETETQPQTTEVQETQTHGLTPGSAGRKEVPNGEVSFKSSLVKDIASLQYYIDGDNYRYGITKDGREVLSFKSEDGSFVDAIMGAGGYVIRDTSFWGIISQPDGIEKFTSYETDGTETLKVVYKTNNGAASQTVYKFYDNHVSITASIDGVNTSSAGTSFFQREFVNGYVDYELKENTKWVFPENNDFPYKDFDSIVSTHYLDSTHKMYTFFRGEEANTYNYFDGYTPEHFPLVINENAFNSYEISYDLVFENLKEDRDSDYLALFMSDGSDMAAGITPVTEAVGNSTIFTTNEVEFNINLTNLLKQDNKYTVEYKIYDYYSNVFCEKTDSGVIKAEGEANYPVTTGKLKSGIFYLDLKVTTENGTYHELYPFGYLPEYNYQYNETSPFGISGIRFGDYQQNDTTVALMKTLGMANARIGISKPEYVNESYDLLEKYLGELKKNGTKITGQYLLMKDWSFSDNAKEFQAEMENALSYVGKYLLNCEVGNETNLYPRYSTLSEAMNRYLNYEFTPGLNALSKNNLDVVASGVYLSQYSWLAEMVSSGLWNKTSVLSTHAYSFPHSPDHVNDPGVDHSFESALVRTRNYLNAYGDKIWYLSEMGVPTTPLNSENMFSGVDLRTQADYTVREFVLGLAYGADVLESYGFYDQLNMQKGTNPYDCEYHYGMFYDQDYYGRVMPKPLALAYGSMTRELESVKDCYVVPTSSNTIKAFGVNLQKDSTKNYFVLWSNCSMLSNDAVEGKRTPNLPWNNQWNGSETLVVYASSEVTVTDVMGNSTVLKPNKNGEVGIEVTGSPIMISGNIYGTK